MFTQIDYYNRFGEQYKDSILAGPEPEIWTTDYAEKGRIYVEMKKRIEQQKELIAKYFNKNFPVLDIGCGFGRQAVLLAKMGFTVIGTDTSDIFINIARNLFLKNDYTGEFLCTDIISGGLDLNSRQILLLDVAEHIKPLQRPAFFKKLSEIAEPGAVLIISLPHIKKRITSILNNRVRRRFTQYFSYFLQKEEHPYPIPEKKEILKLIQQKFSLLKFIESAETDYYVLRRK